MEVDGVVTQALRRLIALPTPTLEGLTHADLSTVAILSVVLYPIHILERDGYS